MGDDTVGCAMKKAKSLALGLKQKPARYSIACGWYVIEPASSIAAGKPLWKLRSLAYSHKWKAEQHRNLLVEQLGIKRLEVAHLKGVATKFKGVGK